MQTIPPEVLEGRITILYRLELRREEINFDGRTTTFYYAILKYPSGQNPSPRSTNYHFQIDRNTPLPEVIRTQIPKETYKHLERLVGNKTSYGRVTVELFRPELR